jgi:hypothetical protein
MNEADDKKSIPQESSLDVSNRGETMATILERLSTPQPPIKPAGLMASGYRALLISLVVVFLPLAGIYLVGDVAVSAWRIIEAIVSAVWR